MFSKVRPLQHNQTFLTVFHGGQRVKTAADVLPFSMFSVSVEKQYLLLVNKQLYKKEDAGPGLKTEGLLPRGNTSFLSVLTVPHVGTLEDVWKPIQPKHNVTQYRLSNVNTKPLKDLFLPPLSSGGVHRIPRNNLISQDPKSTPGKATEALCWEFAGVGMGSSFVLCPLME